MKKGVHWALGVGFALTLAANFVWAVYSIHHAGEKPEEKHEEPKRLSRDESGNAVLKIDKETQDRAALQGEEIREAVLPNEVAAYGRFLEDPARSFTVRSPIAGIVRKPSEREWPKLGEALADGSPVATLLPRFTPLERVDLQSRLTSAQAEVSATTASLEAAKASFERAKALNAQDKTASDRAVQEAEARSRSEAAKLKAAVETVAAMETSLGAKTGTAGPVHLSVDRGGEVVDLPVQPGETIESGQPVLRVATFDRLLARIVVPFGERVPGNVAFARVIPLGREGSILRGERVSLAGSDPQVLGDTFLFSVDAGDLALRPGMALTAYLALPGDPKKGVLIPRSAVVRLEGGLWAYVRTADDKFTRREVENATPVANGWFVPAGFKAGEIVVIAGAQMLLSEERKAKIQGED